MTTVPDKWVHFLYSIYICQFSTSTNNHKEPCLWIYLLGGSWFESKDHTSVLYYISFHPRVKQLSVVSILNSSRILLHWLSSALFGNRLLLDWEGACLSDECYWATILFAFLLTSIVHSHKILTKQQSKPCYLGIWCNPCSNQERCQAGRASLSCSVKPCWFFPRISNGTNSPRLALLYR